MEVKPSFKLMACSILLIALIQIIPTAVSVATRDFFPFGPEKGDTIARRLDDDFAGPVTLRYPFPFFSDIYDNLFVSNNGAISFRRGVREYTAICGALGRDMAMVAPYWTDVDIRNGGDIYFRESTDPTLLSKASADIRRAFPQFRSRTGLAWIFVATWHNVSFYGRSGCINASNDQDPRNTFQAILATDGTHSFAIFYYDQLEWTTGTASGGNCDGLGGSPAKAGFDVGDGETFHEIPGSCTADILQASSLSNVNQAGKWIFRVDTTFESTTCNTERYASGEKLQMNPSFISHMGHIAVSIRGPCLTSAVSGKCRFYDKSNFVDVEATFDRRNQLAFCEVPYLYSYGRIMVDLIVSESDPPNDENVYHGYLYVTEARTNVVAESSLTEDQDGGVAISLSWNPSIFPRGTLLDIILVDATGGEWIETAILEESTPNSGSYLVYLSSNLLGDVMAFRLASRFAHNSAFSNILIGLKGLVSSDLARERCNIWYDHDLGPPTQLEPCPPLLRQAQMDERFELDSSTFHRETLDYYHPGGVASYRQKNPSSNGRHGQQCVYQADGEILVGPPGGGTADWSSPVDRQNVLGHLLDDVLPWQFCCKYGESEAHCRKYYEKRPSDGGALYVAPRQAGGAGDPHITTFDRLTYSFNGVGEFWMIKSTDFSMQARMVQFSPTSGASIFTAFVMDDGATRIQVERSDTDVLMYLDEEIVVFESGQNQLITDTANIEKSDLVIKISFNSGFTFVITGTLEGSLALVASASPGNYGKLTGLLGFFDGNRQNDLRDPNGQEIDGNASLREIHYNFGLKWITTSQESLFIYAEEGTSHATFSNADFVPNFEIPDVASLPADVVTMCAGSFECLFDFKATGSLAFANQTRQQMQELWHTIEALEQQTPMCQPIMGVENGYVSTINFFVGSSVTFVCDEGYELWGADKLHCVGGLRGQPPRWNEDAPTCELQDA